MPAPQEEPRFPANLSKNPFFMIEHTAQSEALQGVPLKLPTHFIVVQWNRRCTFPGFRPDPKQRTLPIPWQYFSCLSRSFGSWTFQMILILGQAPLFVSHLPVNCLWMSSNFAWLT